MALFIVFEGLDGAGKTTQAEELGRRLLRATGKPSTVVHEPGGTALSEAIGHLLKRAYWVHPVPEAELLLFAASRSQLVQEVIRPTLAQHHQSAVIADRFTASTVAYQGYGRGVSLEMIKYLQDYATSRLSPDLTILLDIEPTKGLQRKRPTISNGVQLELFDGASYDRFESMNLEFFDRVRKGYLELAAHSVEHHVEKWAVIPADSEIEVVSEAVWRHVEPLLGIGNKCTQAPF